MAKRRQVPDWEKLLAHAATLQTNVPGAILVGGTAAAVHARHRYSVDHDHVIKDLASHYDKAFASLESIAGWRTNRKVRGKLVLGEMLRVKAFLVVERNTTRDYLDVAALAHHLGVRKSVAALERMNDLYAEFAGEGGDMLTTVVTKLAAPDPYALTDVDLTEYKGIIAPWDDWRAVEAQCRAVAEAILRA